MHEIDVANWEEFEQQLQALEEKIATMKQTTTADVSNLLFRGQSNHTWLLTTTLERNSPKLLSLYKYYRLIYQVKPQIETFTGMSWDIPTYHEYARWLNEQPYLNTYEGNILSPNFPGYKYMIYLRHHSFPSPLLDWTRSPYIAAYFAFIPIPTKDTNKVSIYVLWEVSGGGKGWDHRKPFIQSLGPYVRSHRRHFLQQNEYTICTVFNNCDWYYAHYEDVLGQDNPIQDHFWKFNIPVSERLKVLRQLDKYNLNSFSLFGSEESLMETMSLRALYFEEKDF